MKNFIRNIKVPNKELILILFFVFITIPVFAQTFAETYVQQQNANEARLRQKRAFEQYERQMKEERQIQQQKEFKKEEEEEEIRRLTLQVLREKTEGANNSWTNSSYVRTRDPIDDDYWAKEKEKDFFCKGMTKNEVEVFLGTPEYKDKLYWKYGNWETIGFAFATERVTECNFQQSDIRLPSRTLAQQKQNRMDAYQEKKKICKGITKNEVEVIFGVPVYKDELYWKYGITETVRFSIDGRMTECNFQQKKVDVGITKTDVEFIKRLPDIKNPKSKHEEEPVGIFIAFFIIGFLHFILFPILDRVIS